MSILTVFLVLVLIVLSVGPSVVGAVIARRAWRRHGWPEMRLAYRGFIAGIAILIVSALVLPVVGWLAQGSDVLSTFRLFSAVFAIADGMALIMVIVALYRLASRSSGVASGSRAGGLGRVRLFLRGWAWLAEPRDVSSGR